MAWRALTQADILTGFVGAELNAARMAALASGQADPMAAVIQSVTDEVRGYIAGSVNIVLGAEGTIPDKLINAAIDMSVWYLAKRIPGKILATDQRRDAWQAALRLLRDVAANKFRIEVPTVISTEQIAVPTPAISNRVRERRRRLEDGI